MFTENKPNDKVNEVSISGNECLSPGAQSLQTTYLV